MIYQVPVTSSPSQTLDTTLGGQQVSIYLQARDGHLYIDVYNDRAPVVQGRVCRDRAPIINEAYRGFSGDLIFVDQYGQDDPTYEGIGSRYLLLYTDGTDGE